MAAVTETAIERKRNVAGSMRQQFYQITGVTGDTLDVGLNNVKKVDFDPGVITSYTLTAQTPRVGYTRITFTSSGAFTNVRVTVWGN